MDTRIDFATAEKFNQLELVDWPTKYGHFKFYVRKGLNEVKYNVGTNVTKSANSGEYIKPLTSKVYGELLDVNEILNHEDTWLDVGGHIGLFSIRMATQFPKIKEVISYEALPHNVTFANENIKLNNLVDRCRVVQKAIVPDDSDTIEFFIAADSGKHSIIPTKGRETIQVQATNINNAIAKHQPTAIKMDVEGAEYELIKAIEDWSNISVLIIEWHFNTKQLSEDRPGKFQEIMDILNANFDSIRKIENVEYGKNFITHFVALKNR